MWFGCCFDCWCIWCLGLFVGLMECVVVRCCWFGFVFDSAVGVGWLLLLRCVVGVCIWYLSLCGFVVVELFWCALVGYGASSGWCAGGCRFVSVLVVC